jgi:hypothetical protein
MNAATKGDKAVRGANAAMPPPVSNDRIPGERQYD